VTPGFREAMRQELAYTERKYREGVAGIEYLPEDCQFAVLLAAVLYADHHREIRKRNYDVLSSTPGLSTTRKLWLLAKTRLLWAVYGDPESVFYRVTGLASTAEHAHHHGDPQPAPQRRTGDRASTSKSKRSVLRSATPRTAAASAGTTWPNATFTAPRARRSSPGRRAGTNR